MRRDQTLVRASGYSAGRRKWTRRVAAGALAVSALVVVGAILFRERAVAFDEAIEKVRKASAVRLKIHVNFGNGFEDTSIVTVRGQRVRIENAFRMNVTAIYDREGKVGLLTHPATKRFQQLDLRGGFVSPVEMGERNVLDELLNLKNQKVIRAGSERIGGETTDHFVVRGATAFHLVGDWEIWIPRSSGLPVKARFTTNQRGQTLIRQYDSFEWDPDLDPSTLDTTPPPGYRPGTIFSLEGGGIRIVTDPKE